ncbi:MAG: hypothetical protein QOI60_1138, partial [Actinomycetota bacterium]|nr:hypothetical protein [Actinomycetota bacterium]
AATILPVASGQLVPAENLWGELT